MFKVGDKVVCVNAKLLKGNTNGPDLTEGQNYTIHEIILDRDGNQHLDVGMESDLAFVTSYETKEELPDGDTIHWCHPSRFEKA